MTDGFPTGPTAGGFPSPAVNVTPQQLPHWRLALGLMSRRGPQREDPHGRRFDLPGLGIASVLAGL